MEDEALLGILQDIGLYDVVAALPGNLDANLVEHISTLSGGEIQRLLLARALARSPKLLILDEALSGIAVDDLALVFAALRKNICERGGRIMLSFHSPHMIPYCDFVVELYGAADAPKLGGEPGDSSRGGTE